MRVTSLAQFEGAWRIERRIHDLRAGADGVLEGQALFRPEGDGLAVEETGLLHYAGQPPVKAGRRYLWRGRPGGVEVFFEDGRPFHGFDLGADRAEAHHACAPDSYAVVYDFADFPDWQTVWRVTGPRKDYEMTTRFTRAG